MRSALALLLIAVPLLCASDPFEGVWKLNPAKSKFEPGPAPRTLTFTWTGNAGGVSVRSEGTRADGRPLRESYTAIYDGQERKKPGPWNFDAVINRQISENDREDVFKKSGAVIGTSRLVVSPDGKVLTNTWSFGELRDVRVFDKQ